MSQVIALTSDSEVVRRTGDGTAGHI